MEVVLPTHSGLIPEPNMAALIKLSATGVALTQSILIQLYYILLGLVLFFFFFVHMGGQKWNDGNEWLQIMLAWKTLSSECHHMYLLQNHPESISYIFDLRLLTCSLEVSANMAGLGIPILS
jgi:cellulose synthase/poly-beta-1,6-N-acetylglucosamine synthase-like glycosyltransferase